MQIRHVLNRSFYSLRYTTETEAIWEQEPCFFICFTFWYQAVKIITIAKEWLCRCCICCCMCTMSGKIRITQTVCYGLIMCHAWYKVLCLWWGYILPGKFLHLQKRCVRALLSLYLSLKFNASQHRHHSQDHNTGIYCDAQECTLGNDSQSGCHSDTNAEKYVW